MRVIARNGIDGKVKPVRAGMRRSSGKKGVVNGNERSSRGGHIACLIQSIGLQCGEVVGRRVEAEGQG